MSQGVQIRVSWLSLSPGIFSPWISPGKSFKFTSRFVIFIEYRESSARNQSKESATYLCVQEIWTHFSFDITTENVVFSLVRELC